MAFEDLLKNYSVLNSSPWDRPPELPVPEPSALVNGPNYGPGIRRSLSQGMDLVEPDRKAARNRTLDNIGPMLAFLPLMLAGTKNRKKGLAAFASAMANGITRERESQDALEVWRAEQLNSRKTREAAAIMEEIKEARSMMKEAAALDPALRGDMGFLTAYQAGDITYLARIGWKPGVKEEPKHYEVITVNGRKVVWDRQTGMVVRDLGSAKEPGSGVPREVKVPMMDVTMGDGTVIKVAYDPADPANRSKWRQVGDSRIPEPEPELSLSEMHNIAAWVLGGKDAYGVHFAGIVNLDTPEEVEESLRNQYGGNPAFYRYARTLAFSDPRVRKFYNRPPGSTPAAAPASAPAPSAGSGGGISASLAAFRPGGGAPQSAPAPAVVPQQGFQAKAALLLQQSGGDFEKAKGLIASSRIPEEDKAHILAALEQLRTVPR